MELSKNFEPAGAERKWTEHWEEKRYFRSVPDGRKPYTVVIPPPNVTGVLHMGHTLNETVQDILVRHARMSGYNACWVPGSDHASIATEARVVRMLEEQGVPKSSLSREEFLKHAFAWKEKYGGIIYDQIKRLGCSVDWDRVTFTMDDHYYKAVIDVFIRLYREGLIYRGARMINWDPKARTALSDEEVEYKDVQGTLYHVRYRVAGSDEFIVIATQRPETIMGDTGVCVHPSDERYSWLRGRKVIVPFVNREVPVVFDDYIDPSFGTGILKVTPAHDINDYNLGLKHGLPVIDSLNDDGTISDVAGAFIGMERFAARKAAVRQLREQGDLVKEEQYATRLGYSQRNPDTVVEPRISTQWFVRMDQLAGPALASVTSGDIRIHPGDRFLATYKYWLENVRDWCISRQLWWGQRIPAWYAPDGSFEVAATREEALELFKKSGVEAGNLHQDEDVLDTWFSSWLWPMEVFSGISDPGNEDFKYYYPTQTLVTGQDIIFFWVARMIMAGEKFTGERPFSDVYFTGMVRDKQGRKMSKSLGNSPDLLELIDRYGADAVRFGIMISSPAGNDLLFDEASLEQGRFFNNKLWNALKLIRMWDERVAECPSPEGADFAARWFRSRLAQVQVEVERLYAQFKVSEALRAIYSLIWDDFCSWYLEWVKPASGEPVSKALVETTKDFLEELVHLLHPFMPFITEEVYHSVREQKDDLCVRQYDHSADAEETVLSSGERLKTFITSIRDARNQHQLKPKESIRLYIQSPNEEPIALLAPLLARQVNAEVGFTAVPVEGLPVIAIEQDKFFIDTGKAADTGALRENLQKDLAYQQQFLESVLRKLSNERFVQNAKAEVVDMERKKQADAEARIRTIEESLTHLG